jgi:glyoxylase I family protein
MTGTNSVLGGGGFHHVAVRVADFDGAVHFYSEVLGFSPKVT